MQIKIPRLSSPELVVDLADGDQFFIVGANGSGKSALLQHIVSSGSFPNGIRRISAHRQTWLESGSIAITPEQRRGITRDLVQLEVQTSARWIDHGARVKQSAVLFDLISKDNAQARMISEFVYKGDVEGAIQYASEQVPLFDQLNELLMLGNLTVSLENSSDEEILARHRNQERSFSIAQMSDGERNAAMIAATVLTVDQRTVLLIDEPERHLHRSIIQPFLSALFERRPDCIFIISTHEISLVAANPEACSLMVRSCDWNGDAAVSWDAQLLKKNISLPEELKQDILGARQKILFVEGEDNSLDIALYSVLFPDVTVIPKGSCRDVQRAVAGVQSTHEHHRVTAFGLIDKDDRLDSEMEGLARQNIFALNMYSVEALYFCQAAVQAVANQQAKSLEHDALTLIRSAEEEALSCLRQDELGKGMVARQCERQVRNSALSHLPTWKNLIDNCTSPLSIKDINNPYSEELEHFKALVADGNLYGLIARYPLYKSPVLDRIAKALQCAGKEEYQRRVCSLAGNDERFARELRQHLPDLTEALDG